MRSSRHGKKSSSHTIAYAKVDVQLRTRINRSTLQPDLAFMQDIIELAGCGSSDERVCLFQCDKFMNFKTEFCVNECCLEPTTGQRPDYGYSFRNNLDRNI